MKDFRKEYIIASVKKDYDIVNIAFNHANQYSYKHNQIRLEPSDGCI